MAPAIGMRFYQLSVSVKRNPEPMAFGAIDQSKSFLDFVRNFIGSHTNAVEDKVAERSWYFEEKETDSASTKGYIHYGTFGFESNLVDFRTKSRNYRRKASDVEEIPLFYEMWFPDGKPYGISAFQSFQGRSCIASVFQYLRIRVETDYPGYTLRIKKLMFTDLKGSGYFKSPVKRVRYIKKKASGELAQRYNNFGESESVNLELSVIATRNRSLGDLGNLLKSLSVDGTGLVIIDGIGFDEAFADVRIGNRTRRIGVFGLNADAGLIDLTDAVTRGADGHPQYVSVKKETSALLVDFLDVLGNTTG